MFIKVLLNINFIINIHIVQKFVLSGTNLILRARESFNERKRVNSLKETADGTSMRGRKRDAFLEGDFWFTFWFLNKFITLLHHDFFLLCWRMSPCIVPHKTWLDTPNIRPLQTYLHPSPPTSYSFIFNIISPLLYQ